MKSKGIAAVELLIVTGIVAILALIAVPNFMESQVRSKLGRLKSDMRRVGIACDAYRVDNKGKMFPVERTCYRNVNFSVYGNACYSWWLYIYWDKGNMGPVGEPNPSCLGAWLTSPVAYLPSIPVDPFFSRMLRQSALSQFGAGIKETSFIYYGPENAAIFGWPIETWEGNPNYRQAAINARYPNAGYGLFSCGPDLILDYSPVYDPTNGTVSSGDIVYFGMGIGFVPYL